MLKRVRVGALLLLWGCLAGLIHSPLGWAQALGRPEPAARVGGMYRRALATNPETLDPAFVTDI